MIFATLNNIDNFNSLQNSINDWLKENKEGYNADVWAIPLWSLDKKTIACPLPDRKSTRLNSSH